MKVKKILVFLVIALSFAACKKSSTTPEVKNRPTIASFTASPQTITKGGSTTLSWSTSNATAASITPGIGSVPTSGNQTVSPTETTNYTLTAQNNEGTTTGTTTVTVTIPECQKNHTGTLKLENRSQRSLDYNVIIDNIGYGRLKFGETRSFEVSVGTHTIYLSWADHAGYACWGQPSVIECQTISLYCDQ